MWRSIQKLSGPSTTRLPTTLTMASARVPIPVEQTIGGGSEMSEGLMEIVRPAVAELDEQVKNVRKSQLQLNNHIDQLSQKLKSLSDMDSTITDLASYVQKLEDSRRRVASTASRLGEIHQRMASLQKKVLGNGKSETPQRPD